LPTRDTFVESRSSFVGRVQTLRTSDRGHTDTPVEAGDVEYRENVLEGLESAPDAFFGLFEGTKIGKQLVRVDEPPA
jgi:NADPH-dependent curcumin reductase CurA